MIERNRVLILSEDDLNIHGKQNYNNNRDLHYIDFKIEYDRFCKNDIVIFNSLKKHYSLIIKNRFGYKGELTDKWKQ